MSRVLPVAFACLAPSLALANDFPTQARVEFVLGCMEQRGGQSFDTLYPCVCLIDKIAADMSYAEFAEAQVFTQLRSTPGERGGVFRDPSRAELLRDQLEAATARAEAACFVNAKPRSPSAEPAEPAPPP